MQHKISLMGRSCVLIHGIVSVCILGFGSDNNQFVKVMGEHIYSLLEKVQIATEICYGCGIRSYSATEYVTESRSVAILLRILLRD